MSDFTLPNVDAVVAPVVKANKLFVAHLEKLTDFQFGVLRAYSDVGLSRLKAAVEITDVDGLTAYAEASLAVAENLGTQVQADAQALAELLSGFKAEVEALVAASGAEVAASVPAPQAPVAEAPVAEAPAEVVDEAA